MKSIISILAVGLVLTACKTTNTARNTTGTDASTGAKTTVVDYIPERNLRMKFNRDFPNSTRVVWSKNDLRAYVDFKNSGGFHSDATYGFDGTLLENNIGMDVNKLPVSVKKYLNTKFPNNEILGVYTTRQGYTKKYIFVRLKNTDNVLFDFKGNFLNYKP